MDKDQKLAWQAVVRYVEKLEKKDLQPADMSGYQRALIASTMLSPLPITDDELMGIDQIINPN